MLERFGIMYTIYDNTYDMNNNDLIYTQQSEDEEMVIKGK